MKIRRVSQKGLLGLLHLFFPKECVHCGRLLNSRNREYLCPACRQMIYLISDSICDRCGRPLEGEIIPPVECSSCREDPPSFCRARSSFLLAGAGKSLVLTYKYSRNPYLSDPAINWLFTAGEESYDWSDYDRIIPVPLHPRKSRERGFNQSGLLAAGLSRRTGINLSRGGLIRTRYTGTQTRLSRKERRENVRGAFRVTGRAGFERKTLLLIDDVYTTGATVSECARALMKAGAERVDVLTLARAV